MEPCRLWRWPGRTIPAAMADGFRQRRSINTRRPSLRGLVWRVRICRAFSRTLGTSRLPTWGFWAKPISPFSSMATALAYQVDGRQEAGQGLAHFLDLIVRNVEKRGREHAWAMASVRARVIERCGCER